MAAYLLTGRCARLADPLGDCDPLRYHGNDVISKLVVDESSLVETLVRWGGMGRVIERTAVWTLPIPPAHLLHNGSKFMRVEASC